MPTRYHMCPILHILSMPLSIRGCCSRLESASNKLSAASASKGSALLGILIQHESSGGCGASRNDPHRHESAAAGHALDRQCRLLAADAPRAAQQHSAAGTAPLMPADAPGRQSMAECPLCGSSVPVEQLQAHVDAELQKLDAAASQASSVPSVAIAQHARQVLQSIAVQPSKMAQPTAGLPPRHGLQTGHLRPIRADHGSQRSENALWPQSGPSERHTLSGSSRHWLRTTAQQATAARSSTSGRHFTLPQQSQKPEKSMQQPGLAIPLACRSSAAQQTQRPPRAPHSSGLQAGIPAQPRQQLYHSRQQRERGQPREPCSRSPAQQRAGAASYRQPSGKRKAQVQLRRHPSAS